MKTCRFVVLLLLCFVACQPDDQPTPDNNTQAPSEGSLTTSELNSFQATMLDAVNKLRADGCACGNTYYEPVPALRWNSLLEEAAARHTNDMATNDHFSHTGTDGSKLGDRVRETGYTFATAGENIAWGYNSISRVVQGWKESEGHCRNMMNPNITELGASEADNYWTQVLAKPF
ncbi:MAG: CAP domain-containing protein [Bacteroidota bacterium]